MVTAGRTWRRGVGFFTVALLMNTSRPILDQRPRLELTPSRGNFSKESLGFWIIEPAVLSIIHEVRSRFWKAYSLPVKSKYVFRYLQFCH
jgi:hypothetical protein